ncbi:craniofacial development protein 1 isoform X2 [Austrofundulus limnaeus]|uniref:Craniofacial development protein 1 isoform X2 n=1 Tax=Austrofundulus limnaeus TaxID=52670 RepID=A0A2I4BDB6_AUSLI|nr:PREDICTED: craniofacial development protein 1 isoform X2 [Austrofundulus limnaeus]
MNYSDYDSDGYSSNEDADYIPSDDNLSEDDMNECEQEDPLHEGDTVPHPDLPKKKRKDISKKKKGVQKLKAEEKAGSLTEEAQLPQEAGEDDAKQKKKSDDLWASFLSDVGSRPKDSSPAAPSGTKQETEPAGLKTAPTPNTKVSETAKVTITKVFDFAGEEVRVNKEVAADSREAKSYLKSQNTKQDKDEDKEETSPNQPSPPGSRSSREELLCSTVSVTWENFRSPIIRSDPLVL